MSQADQAIANLDAELAGKPASVGVRMGLALYHECIARKLITLEKFSFGGLAETSKFQVTAYRRTHAVSYWMEMGEWAFITGNKDAD